MALRDKLLARVAPLLNPGEQVQHVFPAQGGVSPWLAGGLGLIGAALFAKPRIIAVTDQAVVVLVADLNGTKPKSVLTRLPRQTRFGAVQGVWSTIQVGDEKLYVHRRFHDDVRAADATVPA